MKTTIKIVLLLLIVITIASCKKTKQEPSDPVPTDTTRQHGKAIGTPVQQTIGPAGGTIKTTDKGLQLVIPQGAVGASVNFSIQEITSTVGPSGISKAYRLLPENVQFSKDIEITFKLSDSLFIRNGVKGNLIRLVYQDAAGVWHFAGKTTFVDYAGTVTVKTRHFSDWAAMSGIKIINEGKDMLSAGETTKFTVITTRIPDDDPTNDDDDLLGPTEESDVDEWYPFYNPDHGTITGDKKSATYTAPASIDIPLQIFPSAYFKAPPIKSSETYSRFSINTPSLLLLPDEYMIWWSNGHFNWATRKFSTVLDLHITPDNQLSINAKENATTVPGRLTLNCRSTSTGSYAFDMDHNYIAIFDGSDYYNSTYTDCDQVPETASGTVTITKSEGPYIEGEVLGYMKNRSKKCAEADIQFIKARFRIKKP